MTLASELESFIDSLGLRYFRGKELTPYWSRKNGKGQNSCPPKHLWPNIVTTLVVLDEVRHLLGAPITITSSYRDPDYNQSVNGATASYHLRFNAVDFQTKGKAPSVVASTARRLRGQTFKNPVTGKPFTFRGGIGLYPTFVHLDTRGHDANF